jgi:hypothetical protein
MYLKHYWRGEAGTAQAEKFAIQLDKRTYVSNKAQLMRVPEEVENLKHILLFKSLKGNAAGRETFNVIYYIFFSAQKIKRQWCEFVHIDDAAKIGRQVFRLRYMDATKRFGCSQSLYGPHESSGFKQTA